MESTEIISPRLTRRASLGLALGGLMAASARAAERAPGFQAVDAAAAKLVSNYATPGLSISVMRTGKLIYSKGFGAANLETGAPVTTKSIFKIGSNTKNFTAAAVMALQEEGKLSVDDKLARFYPDFPRSSEVSLRQ